MPTETTTVDDLELAAGDIVFHPSSGRRGLVIETSTTHADGTARVEVDPDSTNGALRPCHALVVAWFNEISDPIDPADLEAVEVE